MPEANSELNPLSHVALAVVGSCGVVTHRSASHGPVTQLGECQLCKLKVAGSSPARSTIGNTLRPNIKKFLMRERMLIMFNSRNNNATSTDLTATVQQGVRALTMKQERLSARRDMALSAFRDTANELAEVNTGLAETVKVASEMATFFNGEMNKANQAIHDNDAIRQRILDIIGE